MTEDQERLFKIARMIERLSVADIEGHRELNARMWCAMVPTERRFIAISPGGEPWSKYEGGTRKNTTSQGLVFERVDWKAAEQNLPSGNGARIQQFPSSPLYTRSVDLCRKECDWILIHASDISADGMAMVQLGDPGTNQDSIGIGSDLPTAYAAAVCRALAIELHSKESQ